MAQKYIEQYPVSDEHKQAVRMWQHVLDCLDTDPDKLDRQIDWVIKRKLIQSWVDKHETTWTDPRVFMLDLQYHDIRRERSLYYLLERNGAVERLFTDEEVDAAKTEPPQDTRARMRGEFIKLARENSIQYDLDWSNIRLGQPAQRPCDLQQPLRDRYREGGRAGADDPEDQSAEDEPLEARDPVLEGSVPGSEDWHAGIVPRTGRPLASRDGQRVSRSLPNASVRISPRLRAPRARARAGRPRARTR